MWWSSFIILFLYFINFEKILFFDIIELCKTCVIHDLVRNFNSFLLSFLKGPWVSNKISIFDRYLFIEKLTSFSSVRKICSQFFWLKSEINLLLSNFSQSFLKILDLVTGTSGKKSGKKINCRRRSENVVVTEHDSISSKEVELKKYQLKWIF